MGLKQRMHDSLPWGCKSLDSNGLLNMHDMRSAIQIRLYSAHLLTRPIFLNSNWLQAEASLIIIISVTTATRETSCSVPGGERLSCGTIIYWMKRVAGWGPGTNTVCMVDVTYGKEKNGSRTTGSLHRTRTVRMCQATGFKSLILYSTRYSC